MNAKKPRRRGQQSVPFKRELAAVPPAAPAKQEPPEAQCYELAEVNGKERRCQRGNGHPGTHVFVTPGPHPPAVEVAREYQRAAEQIGNTIGAVTANQIGNAIERATPGPAELPDDAAIRRLIDAVWPNAELRSRIEGLRYFLGFIDDGMKGYNRALDDVLAMLPSSPEPASGERTPPLGFGERFGEPQTPLGEAKARLMSAIANDVGFDWIGGAGAEYWPLIDAVVEASRTPPLPSIGEQIREMCRDEYRGPGQTAKAAVMLQKTISDWIPLNRAERVWILSCLNNAEQPVASPTPHPATPEP